ncbi:hypothetical protein [Natrinema versiforme]|nr:hypothetical protein [Natrinema versiforme]
MTDCYECGKVVGISNGEGTVLCRTCSPFGVPTRYLPTSGSGSPEVPADD